MANYHILAVDDDQIVRKILEIVLEAGGYRVRLAASGGEAIEALRSEKFDLVITDLHMGEPDGFAVLKEAKDLTLTEGIVLTSDKDVSLAIKAIRIGVDDYFLKPFSPSRLIERVKKIFENMESNRKAKTTKNSFLEEHIQAMM